MKTKNNEIESGTTTVGLQAKDCSVLGSELRATAGLLVQGKRAKKIYKIHSTLGITTAGSVGDIQQIVRLLRAEARIYKLRKRKKISPEATASLLANILQARRLVPYLGQFMLGGFKEKPQVLMLDPLGGIVKRDPFYATGSGSPIAYGVLEDSYKKDLKEEKAVELVVKAIRSAMKRDIVSGEEIDVAVITKEKFKRLEREQVKQI